MSDTTTTPPSAKPLRAVSSAKPRVYRCGKDLEVAADREPELHKRFTMLSKAGAALVRDCTDPQKLAARLANDFLPALEELFEGFVAKTGGLEHWCSELAEDVEELEEGQEQLVIEPGDGQQLIGAYDAALAVIASLDMSGQSEAFAAQVADAVKQCEDAKKLVGEYVGTPGDKDGEDEDDGEEEDDVRS